MSDAFDPYYLWLGISPKHQPPDHYRLLGLEQFENNPEVIRDAAARQMAHVRTYQLGKHLARTQQVLNELGAAKACLLDASRKAAYDAELRRRSPAASAASPGESTAADGKEFGQYVLLEQLNQSRTGAIFKARHRTMGRIVAIKLLLPQAAGSPQLVERFRRKVKILARLKHPNMVSAYEAGEHQGTHYFVMEYVDGRNLRAILKQHGPLPVELAVNYLVQAARGLACAHAQGVVHRNVKPSNLMVDREGVIKVVGFGLAHVEAGLSFSNATLGGDLTAEGVALGTVDYMAPEQALDAAEADQRADIYSLGCTLHALLTGQPPYPGKGQMQQVKAHHLSPIPTLRAVRSDVPAALDGVFQKMLAKRAEDRYQSMDEVAAALQDLLAARSPSPPPPPAAERGSFGKRLSKAIVALFRRVPLC